MSPFSIKFSSQSEKVKNSAVFSDGPKFRSHTNFIITIMFRIPDIPYILNFQANREKVGNSAVFSDGRNFAHTQIFFISIIFRRPDIPIVPNFKPIGQGLKFREFSEFRAKKKNRRIFLLVPLYPEYPIYPVYQISSESDKLENSTLFSDGRNFANSVISKNLSCACSSLQTFIYHHAKFHENYLLSLPRYKADKNFDKNKKNNKNNKETEE